MCQKRIFGTPPEPLFNMKTVGMSSELLEETLYVLAEKNEKNMDAAGEREGFFKGEIVAEYLLLLCQELGLPAESRFLAIEILDRFMAKHISELYEWIRSNSEENKKENWSEVEKRIKSQLPLRIVSCVQIASKVQSNYKSITPNKARQFLNSVGSRYSVSGILKSELRVLKTLNFSLPSSTALTYVETILEILGHNDSNAQVKVLHDISIKILDIVHLKYHDMYTQLCMAATGEKCSKDDRHKLSVLAGDHMLLAVSVIASASYIVDQMSNDMVLEQLGRITQIPKDDILDFATIILEAIL